MKEKIVHWLRIIACVPLAILGAAVAQVVIAFVIAFLLSIGPFRPDDESAWPAIIGSLVSSLVCGGLAIEWGERIAPPDARGCAPGATFFVGLLLCAAIIWMNVARSAWLEAGSALCMLIGMYYVVKTKWVKSPA